MFRLLYKALEWHPVAVLLALIVLYARPQHEVAWLMAKERGMLEWGTPIVLGIGIIAIAYAWRYVSHTPRIIFLYFTVLAMGMVYFKGEEISWGQHIFGWATPEMLSNLNDQNETNIHNMSSWLDQKPRTVVEISAVIGTMLAGIQALSKSPLKDDVVGWVWPASSVIPAGFCFIIVKLADAAQNAELLPSSYTLGASEGAEYLLAVFLANYAVGFMVRVRAKAIDARR